ncbi:MAG TPA: 3-hydroxyacyl-ACP dehydratase FabZ [Firmicutes bacterium]|nr:3-hydroxyacyl-ACP dehydratase FabZ [Candidatus Fermentithermobacillaceae bacterium]
MKKPLECRNNGSEDLRRITAILPHREPFLFLSRIISVQNGQSATAEYDVPQDHVFFEGHFPQEPVFPGVIILEMMAQTGALAVLCDSGRRGQVAYLAAIESARFRRPVRPGETVRAEVEIESMRMKIGRAKGAAYVNGQEVASAHVIFALSV